MTASEEAAAMIEFRAGARVAVLAGIEGLVGRHEVKEMQVLAFALDRFIHQWAFSQHLLYVAHYSGCWGCDNNKIAKSLPSWTCNSTRKTTTYN